MMYVVLKYVLREFMSLQVSVLEMDGQFDKIEELIYVESHLSNTSAKFYGEITQQMLKNSQFPGSNNGTGLFQTIVGLKIREVCSLLPGVFTEPLGHFMLYCRALCWDILPRPWQDVNLVAADVDALHFVSSWRA